MGYSHTESEAGISWYTHMWQMFPEGVPASCELQIFVSRSPGCPWQRNLPRALTTTALLALFHQGASACPGRGCTAQASASRKPAPATPTAGRTARRSPRATRPTTAVTSRLARPRRAIRTSRKAAARFCTRRSKAGRRTTSAGALAQTSGASPTLQVRKTPLFLSHFYRLLKSEFTNLPRHARDKHRESTQNRPVFERNSQARACSTTAISPRPISTRAMRSPLRRCRTRCFSSRTGQALRRTACSASPTYGKPVCFPHVSCSNAKHDQFTKPGSGQT